MLKEAKPPLTAAVPNVVPPAVKVTLPVGANEPEKLATRLTNWPCWAVEGALIVGVGVRSGPHFPIVSGSELAIRGASLPNLGERVNESCDEGALHVSCLSNLTKNGH